MSEAAFIIQQRCGEESFLHVLSDNRIGYSTENLKIHTVGPLHSLPLLSRPLPSPACTLFSRSHSCISPLHLKVGPLYSS